MKMIGIWYSLISIWFKLPECVGFLVAQWVPNGSASGALVALVAYWGAQALASLPQWGAHRGVWGAGLWLCCTGDSQVECSLETAQNLHLFLWCNALVLWLNCKDFWAGVVQDHGHSPCGDQSKAAGADRGWWGTPVFPGCGLNCIDQLLFTERPGSLDKKGYERTSELTLWQWIFPCLIICFLHLPQGPVVNHAAL